MKVAFDFETDGIEAMPDYPPKPRGLAIQREGDNPFYMAWGHPTENNSSEEFAKQVLTDLWNDPDIELIAQNVAFDLAVAHKHWGLTLFPKARLHDTMVQGFLLDPYAKTYSLKPTAARVLNLPPEEQDAVRDWLIANEVVRSNDKGWGAHICKAPGGLVGEYANGDVLRTLQLFNVYEAQIQELGMAEAYARELELIPIMLENTFEGITIDLDALKVDCGVYETALKAIEGLIWLHLGREQGFNIDSDAELQAAIDNIHPMLIWPTTDKGSKSVSKESLDTVLKGLDDLLLAALQYRASVSTCLNTFMKPWLIQAEKSGDSRIRCQWNTTRSDTTGARTGRLSSTPSFMNIPTLKSIKFARAIELAEQYLPKFPTLPAVRSYIVADSDEHVLVDLDFSAQELRVLAHFADGQLLQQYKANPELDLHQYAADMMLKQTGKKYTRKQTKGVAFSIMYGSGLATLAKGLGATEDEAREVKAHYLEAVPAIQELNTELKWRGKNGKALRTWGGRLYHVEPAKYVDGRWRDFSYKLLNYLIQGSSADLTKQAIINWKKLEPKARLIVTVHDQIVVCCKLTELHDEALKLKKAMTELALDCPLTVEGERGFRWTELSPIEDTK